MLGAIALLLQHTEDSTLVSATSVLAYGSQIIQQPA